MFVFIYSVGCGTPRTDCDSDDEYWIGLVKYEKTKNKKNDWQWLDGTEYNWQNWYPGEPTGYTGVVKITNSGEWKDNGKASKYRYICSKEPIIQGTDNYSALTRYFYHLKPS